MPRLDCPCLVSDKLAMRHGPIYHQCCEIQRLLMADMKNTATTPTQRASLAKAWDTMEDRKRILKGKGEPKPVDATKKPRFSIAQSALAD